VDLLRLNTLRGTKPAFLTPERYDEHSHPFLYGSPPWWLWHVCFISPSLSIIHACRDIYQKVPFENEVDIYAGICPCNLGLKTNVYVCYLTQRIPLYTLDTVSPCLPDTNKGLFIFQSFDRKLIFFKPLCKSLLRHISKDRCCVSAWPVKWQALGMP